MLRLIRNGKLKAVLLVTVIFTAAAFTGCKFSLHMENGHWVKELNPNTHAEERHCESGGHECVVGGHVEIDWPGDSKDNLIVVP